MGSGWHPVDVQVEVRGPLRTEDRVPEPIVDELVADDSVHDFERRSATPYLFFARDPVVRNGRRRQSLEQAPIVG